jgi:alkylhydroperoxidase family enzyme
MADTPLASIPRDQLPEEFQPAWDALNGLTGEPTFVEVFAQAPEVLRFVMNDFYAKLFFGGAVDNHYKQLVRLKLSLVHGCRTCNKQNVPGALEAGITQEQVDAMDDYAQGPFTDAEKAVLEFADQMVLTNMAGDVSAERYRRLAAHFSDAEICELGTVMAVVAGMAKLSFILHLVEREEYCPFGQNAA